MKIVMCLTLQIKMKIKFKGCLQVFILIVIPWKITQENTQKTPEIT